MTRYLIRYTPGTDLALHWPSVRYPVHTTFPSRERAEQVRLLCPNAEKMETVEVDE